MKRYLALLRGINVGGRNRIRMTELRACFESAGFADVRTYIQSGNVLFSADEPDGERLRGAVEAMLTQAFDYSATVEVRDHEEMRAVVAGAPSGFGDEPGVHRYDVMLLLPPLTPAEVLEALTVKEGVDAVWAGPGAVYFSRVIARASSSGLSRIVSHPVYQRMTVRNWKTTTRLLAMMEQEGNATPSG